ncbi:MAG: hypothetical protein DRI84_07480, partial [Bacteroidetes bacterium]
MNINIEIPADISVLLKSDMKNKLDKIQGMGYSQYEAKFYMKAWKQKQQLTHTENETDPEEDVSVKKEFKGDKGSIDVQSLTIKTIDGALEAADVDLEKWEVDRGV